MDCVCGICDGGGGVSVVLVCVFVWVSVRCVCMCMRVVCVYMFVGLSGDGCVDDVVCVCVVPMYYTCGCGV